MKKIKRFFLFLIPFIIVVAYSANAQRKFYGGKRHTTSHGGSYAGGHGKSHKGGHYHNSASYNRYGIHKVSGRRRK